MFDFARRKFEEQYDSKLTIKEWKSSKVGAVTKGAWVTTVENVPCRISQKRQINPTESGDYAKMVNYPMLYCAPEVEIEAGSEIYVTDCHGKERKYKRSSEGFDSYRTHQEIAVVRDVTA